MTFGMRDKKLGNRVGDVGQRIYSLTSLEMCTVGDAVAEGPEWKECASYNHHEEEIPKNFGF